MFSFLSSLYFRGKLAYARAFGHPDGGVLVITPGDGLVPPSAPIRLADLARYAGTAVDPAERRYRDPLLQDLAARLARWSDADVVLLGSIATTKYTEVLGEVLGNRLLFPPDFVGRGDMSRGGLMLRCVREGRELAYAPIAGATLHGPKPPRLSS